MRAARPFVALAPVLLLSSGLFAASATDLLRRAEEADRNVSYRGMKTATVRFSGGVATAVLKVVHLKPDMTRTEYFSPGSLAGMIVIQHGNQGWKYCPSEEVWEQLYPNYVLPTDTIRQEALENYNLRLLGVETVAGRPSVVVHAAPKRPGEFPRRIWVDREFYLVMATQVENTRGAIVNSSRYTSIEFNPRDISPSIFRVTGRVNPAPRKPGKRADFHVARPTYLPKGYRLLGVESMTVNGRTCVHVQFSNGANTISMFQRAADGKAQGAQARGKFTNVLTWVRDGLMFTLVGNISRDELRKIADSVK